MVEFCREPEGVDGLYEESIERWRNLRTNLIEQTSHWWIPEQLNLSDGYFDNLPDHGPLTSLPASQLPPLSGHTDIETGIRQSASMESASDANNNR